MQDSYKIRYRKCQLPVHLQQFLLFIMHTEKASKTLRMEVNAEALRQR